VLASIRVRLTLSHLAVIVLAMALSGFVMLSLVEGYFLQAMEDSLLVQARITAHVLVPGVTLDEPLPTPFPSQAGAPAPPGLALAPAYNAVQQQQLSNLSLQAQNLASPAEGTPLAGLDLTYLASASLQLSSQLETRIRILDADGRLLVDSQQIAAAESTGTVTSLPGDDLAADPLVLSALQGTHASRVDDASGERSMHLAFPAVVQGRPAGVIYLSQPLRDVTAVLHDLRLRWLLSTGVALALSGGAGLLLSGAIAGPLRRLTAAAGAVARGHFDQQVPVRSQDEVGRLSRAFNDMTARLQAARHMQVAFVADVSHELRTPLTSIKGMLETLRAGAVDDSQVRDSFLETAEAETDRLIRLVNDLLLLSRVDAEALTLRREACDLVELARGSWERLAFKAEERGLTCTLELAPDVPPVWIDPDRIEQVLINLLDNAIKYSRPGGALMVRIDAAAPGSVVVQVSDRGIGIPAGDLPHIGRRFYRADKARSRGEGGSGLGLAIAQALVRAHGGDLWLESREGEGTTVRFSLPSA
jgi:signal transduction histidine kinase